MGRVAERRAERVGASAQLVADGGEQLGKPLHRDADDIGTLDLPDRAGVDAGGTGHGRLAEPGGDPALAQLAPELDPEVPAAPSSAVDGPFAAPHEASLHDAPQRGLTWASTRRGTAALGMTRLF